MLRCATKVVLELLFSCLSILAVGIPGLCLAPRTYKQENAVMEGVEFCRIIWLRTLF